MALELNIEILGSPFVVEVPDDEWLAFVELMWRPFVIEPARTTHASRIRIRRVPVWTWALEGEGGEELGAGDDRWFLAGELRYWLVDRAIRRVSDAVLLHASVVERDARAVLLVGESGGGKTTLSLALAGHGWGYHADDLAAIDPETRRVRGIPTPAGIRDPRRWHEFEHLWADLKPTPPKGSFLVPAAPFVPSGRAMEASTVAFLSFSPGASPTIETVRPGEAVVLCAQHSDSRAEVALAAYARLCREARCVRLRYGSSPDAVALLNGPEARQKSPGNFL